MKLQQTKLWRSLRQLYAKYKVNQGRMKQRIDLRIGHFCTLAANNTAASKAKGINGKIVRIY